MKRVTLLALLVVAYAWFASGVQPFTPLAYVLVALTALVVLVTYSVLGGLSPRRDDVRKYYVARSDAASLANASTWLSLLLLAVALEVVALALGGRNTTVPTLSTTVDHLLVTREGRWLLYALWLSVGVGPLLRLAQRHDMARN